MGRGFVTLVVVTVDVVVTTEVSAESGDVPLLVSETASSMAVILGSPFDSTGLGRSGIEEHIITVTLLELSW